MDINCPIESAAKKFEIRPAVIKEMGKLGISTVSDLLFYFPGRHEDFSNIVKISGLREGQPASIKAVVNQIRAVRGFRGFRPRAEAVVSDESGSIKIVWFNQPYIADVLAKGETVFFSGTPRQYKGLQFQNPIYEAAEAAGSAGQRIHTGRIIPIYKTTAKLAQRTLRNAIFKILRSAGGEIKEYLPEKIIKQNGFPGAREAIKNLHFPEDAAKLGQAKKRFAFEEIFEIQLALQKQKRNAEKQKSFAIPLNKNLIQGFISNLPFQITGSQDQAIRDILQDLGKSVPASRLLEGDVGSGKTLVAFAAALEALDAGFQAAMLCPTEILAMQHYKNALAQFENYPYICLILLTSQTTLINGVRASKKEVLEEIAHDKNFGQFVISTHAILQKNVEFKKLALIIIDEQHRFGVRQRAHLLKNSGGALPHLLSMSATPIPLSLQMSLLGNLQISQIKQKPQGRKQIMTRLASENARQKIYAFLRQEIKKGGQAFVVTPLISSEENAADEDLKATEKAAENEQKLLQKIFPEFKIGLVHGKMKAREKETIMREFLENKIQILVSTSVIEVGVDVPNANIMVIEGAARFGLAQLHQLRGRVGRSEKQSYCFLFQGAAETPAPSAETGSGAGSGAGSGKTKPANGKPEQGEIFDSASETKKRLQYFEKISDGFELAEMDLKMRGFGDIFGEEQSGLKYFKYFAYEKNLAEAARKAAEELISEDAELKKYPYLAKRIRNVLIHLE